MKPLTCFLLLFTFAGSAQNYQPINSNSLQVFYQAEQFPLVWQADGNMWGTKIDSVQVLPVGDSIYYNYPIYRDTAAENGNFNGDCIWWNAPNWNGTQTRIEVSGSTWLYNQLGDSVRIDHGSPLNSEWSAFNYQNGDSLMAQVVDIQWVDDGWISDSVKTIGFTRYSNGQPTPDNMNDVEVEIYKNAGFRKMVDFTKFPYDTTRIVQVHLNFINKYSPGYSVNGVVNPLPTVGDGFCSKRTCSSQGVECPSGWNSSTSILVQDVAPFGTDGQFSATVLYISQSGASTVVNRIYDPLPDTLYTLIQKNDGGNLMPREQGANYNYSSESPTNENECSSPVVTINNGMYYGETSSCIGFGFAECTYSAEQYSPFVGQVGSSWSVDDDWCSAWAFYSTSYSYFQIGGIDCWDCLIVGTPEINEPKSILIYPNPTNGQVQLSLQDASFNDVTVTVSDLVGRLLSFVNG
ncbi:MAG: hypothetical protein JKX84_04400, partial [Flavobacteriales bacterium]|nr:hypothetical protein [Flavobacteriales bacterium]